MYYYNILQVRLMNIKMFWKIWNWNFKITGYIWVMIIMEINRLVCVYVGESLINIGKNNFTLVINEGHNEERSITVVSIILKVITHCILMFVDLGYKIHWDDTKWRKQEMLEPITERKWNVLGCRFMMRTTCSSNEERAQANETLEGPASRRLEHAEKLEKSAIHIKIMKCWKGIFTTSTTQNSDK